MNLYLDTSALSKRYLEEAGSKELGDLLSGEPVTGASIVAIAEVVSAFRRAATGGRVSDEAASLARETFFSEQERLVWFNVDRAAITLASSLAWKHALRGFDAVHLGAAVSWSRALGAQGEFLLATFDTRLAEAARAEGLTVWPG